MCQSSRLLNHRCMLQSSKSLCAILARHAEFVTCATLRTCGKYSGVLRPTVRRENGERFPPGPSASNDVTEAIGCAASRRCAHRRTRIGPDVPLCVRHQRLKCHSISRHDHGGACASSAGCQTSQRAIARRRDLDWRGREARVGTAITSFAPYPPKPSMSMGSGRRAALTSVPVPGQLSHVTASEHRPSDDAERLLAESQRESYRSCISR